MYNLTKILLLNLCVALGFASDESVDSVLDQTKVLIFQMEAHLKDRIIEEVGKAPRDHVVRVVMVWRQYQADLVSFVSELERVHLITRLLSMTDAQKVESEIQEILLKYKK